VSDDLKSALDLALEKLDKEYGVSRPSLSENQKRRIAELRKRYQAKIAETEIALESKIREAIMGQDFEKVEETRRNLTGEKRRLEEEMEREVAQIRGEGADA
jgi:hypothetical protein